MTQGTVADAALETLWRNTLDHTRSTVPAPVFRSWFEIITPACLDGDRLRLRVPSGFAREWIETHYIPLIVEVASAAAGRPLELAFEVEVPVTEPAADVDRAVATPVPVPS